MFSEGKNGRVMNYCFLQSVFSLHKRLYLTFVPSSTLRCCLSPFGLASSVTSDSRTQARLCRSSVLSFLSCSVNKDTAMTVLGLDFLSLYNP